MAETKSETDHLQSTIEAIDASIEKESVTGSTPKITSWIKTLHEHKDLQPIAKDLEKLKDAIAAKDSKKISSLLEKLGNATVTAAEKAEGKESTMIKKLGKSLLSVSKLANKLAGEEAK